MSRTVAAGLAFIAPAVAVAGSVYLNNVNIDGIVNQRFEKATVRIDERGNVFIDAPGYMAKQVDVPPAAPPPPAPAVVVPAPAPPPAPAQPVAPPVAVATMSRRYWLVTEQTAKGMTEFDVDLYINSKWIRKLRSQEDALVAEVTRFLVPGKNSVLLTARKVMPGARRSYSPEHVFRVIIGEGNVGGNNVMIDNPVIRFERSAAEVNDISQEFVLITR